MSLEAKLQTMKFEGWRGNTYKDTRGNPTIGWGFNLKDSLVKSLVPLDVQQGKRELTQAEAIPIFNKLYERAESTARDYIGDNFDKLPEQIKNIVTDMSYNMGDKVKGFEDMKKAILTGDSQGIGFAMKDSKWFKQVGNRSQAHFDSVVALGDY
jgi:GH24 family phage-related lysozyme (muramidase)